MSSINESLALAKPSATKSTSLSVRDKVSLKKSCEQFEALFIESLFKSMRETIPEGGIFEKDNATRLYEEMFDHEIASQIAQKQSVGLAEQMYRQMEKNIANSK